MEEGDHAGEAPPGCLVDQSSPPAGQQVELALEVLHLEAYVVKRLAAAVDKPGYCPIRVRGLDELQLRSAHTQQGRPDPLVGLRDDAAVLVDGGLECGWVAPVRCARLRVSAKQTDRNELRDTMPDTETNHD